MTTTVSTSQGTRSWVPLALTFAIAQLIEVFLHEGSHAVAALALGYPPTIGQFVENSAVEGSTSGAHAVIAAAGPVGSLVVGLLFCALYRRPSRRHSFGGMLMMWMAMTGIVSAVGYVVVMPFLTIGDTAVVADTFGIPVVARYAIAAGSMVALYFACRPLTTMWLDTLPDGVPLITPDDRRRTVTRLWIPYLIGFVLLIPAGVGGDPLIVLVGLFGCWGPGMALVGFMTMWARRPYERPTRAEERAAWPTPAWGFVLYVAIVAFYLLALRPGLSLPG